MQLAFEPGIQALRTTEAPVHDYNRYVDWSHERYGITNEALAVGMACPKCGKMMSHIKGTKSFICDRCRTICTNDDGE